MNTKQGTSLALHFKSKPQLNQWEFENFQKLILKICYEVPISK